MNRTLKPVMLWAFGGALRQVIFAIAVLFCTSTDVICAREVNEAVLEMQRERIEVIRRISERTVAVFGLDDAAGGGSAVVISSDGYALTNFHVTKPVGTHLKCGMNDGQFYDAVIVGMDPTGDVALIKLLGRDDFPYAEMGNSDLVQAGDWCIVSGNPFLLATDFHPTVTYGIVSGVHRYQYPAGTLLEYADCIQTDASINPGNSGGPLWNAAGQLIGINGRGSFEKRGRVNVGVGYAISINQIKNFMGYLRSGRIVDHATLGATVATDDRGRVVVTEILRGSDAYRRGLRYGDEIIAFAGRSVSSANGFKNILGTIPKGWRVPITYVREGEQVETLVRLPGVHRSEELLAKLQLGGIAPPAPNEPKKQERDRQGGPKEPGSLPEVPPAVVKGKNAATLDPKIQNVFQEKRGYANYHFNKIKQESIWQRTAWKATGKQRAWKLIGELHGKPFEVVLGDRLAAGRIQGVFQEIDFDNDLVDQRSPRGTGGLLLALHQWRRFLVNGIDQFGDVFYQGVAPRYEFGQPDPKHEDVLVGTFDVMETRFYFEQETGVLNAMEVSPDVDEDPCELHFRSKDNRPRTGTAPPADLIEVVFGDSVYGTIELKEIAFVDVEVQP